MIEAGVIILLVCAYLGLQSLADRVRRRSTYVMKSALTPKGEHVFRVIEGGRQTFKEKTGND